ncbi:F-box only protein 41 isoform X1 [Triplophysa rosa]|uniref:F-box only protein 41 isoform X1 n=1 Tax=Triplophysa rosa TaxID=992332 RepID=UPI0025461987|nr:F-box only protein 41 isoform X1 [Triplophysa rosa]XP_057175348.1 F-box only protein 41 isoform X1 [Triplophysa rosa]
MSASTKLPPRCPTCGETCPSCDHTCPMLCVTPRWRSEGVPAALQESDMHLDLLDALSLARPLRKIFIQRDSPSVLPASLSPLLAEGDAGGAVTRLGVPWLGRLALEARLQQLALEVQERVSLRLETLQEEVKRRSAEVRRARRESERMDRERREAEERAAQLERQVDISVEMLADLRYELREREQQLQRKQQSVEVCELDRYVRDTALREASAKTRLQRFIEDILERAERAELQLENIHLHDDVSSPHRHLTGSRASGYQRSNSVSGKVSSHLCDHRASPGFRYEVRRPRTLSVGSGGCEGHWRGGGLDHQHMLCLDGGSDSHWMIQNAHTDSDNCSLYTTRSQDDSEYRTYSRTGRDVSGLKRTSIDSLVCSERLRLKAGLFCVFIYLDTYSLLTAAEVSKDWRSVARHPAVWTRVTLENARVSSKFLMTLSQWCCQTQSVVLHNLKPRPRSKNESKDEHLKATRGCLEAGLEAVLKSAGRSLVALSISHCPNVLTDRSLWLVSCHCRSLQSLTYRSASDPAGQEVIWALGAGCRDITTLHVAPLQPCSQPSRFSNRCLQTIGRCWPNLCRVGVGGAGCGVQGLASLVRNCVNLCELELNHMNEVNQDGAADICKDGLQQLHTLTFISTPVTAKAILHFKSVCVNLRRIVVQLSIADYFEDVENEEAQRLFVEIISNLQMLRKRSVLSDVLHITSK